MREGPLLVELRKHVGRVSQAEQAAAEQAAAQKAVEEQEEQEAEPMEAEGADPAPVQAEDGAAPSSNNPDAINVSFPRLPTRQQP